MVLLVLPAFVGIKRKWQESAESLSANNFQFWWDIGIPVLMPSLIAGEVRQDSGVGIAMVVLSLVITGLSIGVYQIAMTRARGFSSVSSLSFRRHIGLTRV